MTPSLCFPQHREKKTEKPHLLDYRADNQDIFFQKNLVSIAVQVHCKLLTGKELCVTWNQKQRVFQPSIYDHVTFHGFRFSYSKVFNINFKFIIIILVKARGLTYKRTGKSVFVLLRVLGWEGSCSLWL